MYPQKKKKKQTAARPHRVQLWGFRLPVPFALSVPKSILLSPFDLDGFDSI